MYANRRSYTHENIRSHPHTEIANRRRAEDHRSEQRIILNRIRRQQEIRKNSILFIITVCFIIACSFTLNTFRSNAKSNPEVSYKYYKSITVANNDTLWSLAEKYMDDDHYDSIIDYINEVKRVNSLASDSIHYGEYLIIPYYDSRYIE